MNLESNSPPPGLASPMELCFADIADAPGKDDIDLNNITPSLKLSSSLNFYDSNDYDNFSPIHSHNSFAKSGNKSSPAEKAQRDVDFQSHSNSRDSQLLSTICSESISKQSQISPSYDYHLIRDIPTLPTRCVPEQGGVGKWIAGSTMSSGSVDSTVRGKDTSSNAMMRARTKKDSHNRIERKRRDYINCQISELGKLLPDSMFRDNECKKNKGSILKNSVEYICELQTEQVRCSELRKETHLATTVISDLMKRIQDIEAMIASEYSSDIPKPDYKLKFQQWLNAHEANLHTNTVNRTSLSPRPTFLSLDTSESSPGMCSIGNDDLSFIDIKCTTPGDCNSPIPIGNYMDEVQTSRYRCTSLSIPGKSVNISMFNKANQRPLSTLPQSLDTMPFGSLPATLRMNQSHPSARLATPKPPCHSLGNVFSNQFTNTHCIVTSQSHINHSDALCNASSLPFFSSISQNSSTQLLPSCRTDKQFPSPTSSVSLPLRNTTSNYLSTLKQPQFKEHVDGLLSRPPVKSSISHDTRYTRKEDSSVTGLSCSLPVYMICTPSETKEENNTDNVTQIESDDSCLF